MTDKAMICVRIGDHYQLFYKDSDGQPTELAETMIAALRRRGIGEAIEEVGAASLGQWVSRPAQAFLEVRSDIHWIYVISEDKPAKHKWLTVYKTSYDSTHKRFAWPLWSQQVDVFDKVVAVRQMEIVETVARMMAGALAAYERAV